MAKSYNFGEKKTEFNAKLGKEVEVWQSPKYIEAKKKAIEALESEQYKNVLSESDFWILMNATKSGKMAYTGLIISHNGCLKINDALPEDKRFKPSCMTLDKDGYSGSLVFSYESDAQGIYEVGEVNKTNCSNAYPYAMALKRCMDRVILKNSRLAYAGIYSDSEAEEFKNDKNEPKETNPEQTPKEESDTPLVFIPEGKNARQVLVDYCKEKNIDIVEVARIHKLNNTSSDDQFMHALSELIAVHG